MKRVVIVGASGYSGAELVRLVSHHPHFELTGIFVSEQSADKHKPLSELYGNLRGQVDLALQPLDDSGWEFIEKQADFVCLCTEHSISAALAPKFLALGKKVFDLSGAFRLPENNLYQEFYGFDHPAPELLKEAVYGLAEVNAESIANANLVAVPGCYPTAALLALLPLKKQGLLNEQQIIVNAVSGVSGAGRKASLTSAFCEVSFTAYGLFEHRHTPEISHYLDHPVLFTPHLAAFKRGIVETIYAQLQPGVGAEQINACYEKAYQDKQLVRLLKHSFPSINDVAGLPYADLSFQVKGQQLVIGAAIDNLLKGAAGQAMQCMNLATGQNSEQGLVGS